MKNLKKGVVAVVASLALTLTACGGSSETSSSAAGGDTATSANGGEINLGVAYETTNYDPSSTSSALAMGTNWHVVEGLYELNMNDYSTRNALAKEHP